MGQRMSSDNQHVQRSGLNKAPAAAGAVVVLPSEADLLGRCWLLASSPDSLSPSRWFALSVKNRSGVRGDDRRAFTISPDVLPSGERSRQPVLRDANINVHKGLSVCGYSNITIASVVTTAGQPQRTVRVGGVHVELPPFTPPPLSAGGGGEGEAEAAYQCVVVVVRRVSVEAELRDYATASYTRVAVSAPPTNAKEREDYGEGCITGILYGAVVTLAAPLTGDVASVLARLCGAAAEASGVPPSLLQVQEEHMQGVQVAGRQAVANTDSTPCESEAGSVRLLSVEAAAKTAEALRREWTAWEEGAAPADGATAATTGKTEEALQSLAAWVVHVHQRPSTWCPLNLFLQRYEAVAESLLVKSRKGLRNT